MSDWVLLPVILIQLFDIRKDVREHDWYHGAVPRLEANTLLKEDGDFLLRESQNSPGDFVLSVKHEGTNKHFKINTNKTVSLIFYFIAMLWNFAKIFNWFGRNDRTSNLNKWACLLVCLSVCAFNFCCIPLYVGECGHENCVEIVIAHANSW